MKQHFFMTPSTNNKPGEIIEVRTSGETVQQYAAPIPYFEISPSERDALEAERKQLLDSLPTLLLRDRIIAEDRVQRIEFDLRRARSGTETSRRDGERAQERIREATGDPNVGSNPTSGNKSVEHYRKLAANGVCCSGKYLCATCQAKSAPR